MCLDERKGGRRDRINKEMEIKIVDEEIAKERAKEEKAVN